MNRRFALVFALGLSTLATVAHVDTAEAGRYRFGGGGRVHVHARAPGVSVGVSRGSYYRPRSWSAGGRVWYGGRYSRGYYPRYRYRPSYYPYYRPYYSYYYYQPVPSYYGYYEQNYYPVQPAPEAPPSVAVAAAPARRALPRFGVGLFAGGISVEDRDESTDWGGLARFRLTPGLIIEGEIGKTSYEDNLRVDRRLGASLIYEIGAYNRLAPYVLAGAGVQQADVGDDFTTTQNFGEVGVGLRLAITPHLHILGDIRVGSRVSVDEDGDVVVNRSVLPPPVDSDESEEYTRGRISAVLYF